MSKGGFAEVEVEAKSWRIWVKLDCIGGRPVHNGIKLWSPCSKLPSLITSHQPVCNTPSLLPTISPMIGQWTWTGRVEFSLGDHERAKRSSGSEQAMMVTPTKEACSETLFRWPWHYVRKEDFPKIERSFIWSGIALRSWRYQMRPLGPSFRTSIFWFWTSCVYSRSFRLYVETRYWFLAGNTKSLKSSKWSDRQPWRLWHEALLSCLVPIPFCRYRIF